MTIHVEVSVNIGSSVTALSRWAELVAAIDALLAAKARLEALAENGTEAPCTTTTTKANT